jgi:adenosylmethionine---8-amino-7-oxononanoate aminotransferase
MNSRADALLSLDRAHVWHPYSSLPPAHPPLVVESAQGVRIRLNDGRELIDGMSSWWSAIHGYRHPVLDEAVRTQLGRMAHVMFGGLTHEPAIRLASKLVELAPPGLESVFFSDSGSVSVEVAIKMAVQYWHAVGRADKSRLITVRGGYHGDSVAAMSVCDPVDGMHQLFTGLLPEQVFAPIPGPIGTPADASWLASTTELFDRHAGTLAAAIVEPVVQGAGGMRFYDPSHLSALRVLCDQYDVLLIVDEVATGFGRAGTMFASEQADVAPDIMCVGKALTGGYLSMAATLCARSIAEAVSAGPGGAFMHGPTFMANPLAAAVANANLELLTGRDWSQDIKRVETGLRHGLEGVADLDDVRDVRVHGAIGVIQMHGPVDVTATTQSAIDHGVWLRPFRDLIYTMPPYICTDDEIATIAAALSAAASRSRA